LGILGSLFVAAVFAVHPLHVESVAWISERKDVLSGVFYLSALTLYLDSQRTGQKLSYAGSLACGVLALMSKPVAVTLPAVLVLLHWYAGGFKDWKGALPNKKVLLQWLPFIVGSVIVAALTLLAQTRVGTLGTLTALPVADRLDNMWLAYLAYVRRFLWPVDLCVGYGFDPSVGRYGILGLVPVAAVTILLWRFRQRWPQALLGWLLFLVMLLPVIGLIQVGPQSSADRYMYLPLLGLTLVLADVGRTLSRSFAPRIWRAGGAMACLALTLVSTKQAAYWQDSVTLFSRAVAVQPTFWFARLGLGTALTAAGRFDEALEHLYFALKLPGNTAEAYRILGVCMFGQRSYADALEHFQRSYNVKPTSSAALMLAHLYSGQDDQSLRNGALALQFAELALRDVPDPDGKALLSVAAAHAAAGQLDKAIAYADRARQEGAKNDERTITIEAEKRLRAYKNCQSTSSHD
jgi:hypothetical protein